MDRALDPFTQGYVEAMLRTLDEARMRRYRDAPFGSPARAVPIRLDVSWLAPETLAAVRRDCKRESLEPSEGDPREEGRVFWRLRHCGAYSNKWAPLAPYLADDGKVRLREIEPAA